MHLERISSNTHTHMRAIYTYIHILPDIPNRHADPEGERYILSCTGKYGCCFRRDVVTRRRLGGAEHQPATQSRTVTETATPVVRDAPEDVRFRAQNVSRR